MKDITSHSRKGFFIEFFWEDGEVSWGEVAPFPGLHKKSFEDVQLQFKYILRNFNKKALSSFSPTVKLALAQAINLKGLKELPIPKIKIAPLLEGSNQEILDEAKKLKNASSVKLKLGRKTLKEEIELFNQLVDILPKNTLIRGDVNRKWNLNQAQEFASNIDKNKVEYLEEPLQNPKELEHFFETSQINYALDETIYETRDISDLTKYKNTLAYIIKPSLLNTQKLLVDLTAEKDIPGLIFSSAFESGYSLLYYIFLAREFSDLSIAQGFDTYKWLADDILKEKLDLQKISSKETNNSLEIERSKLKPIGSFEI